MNFTDDYLYGSDFADGLALHKKANLATEQHGFARLKNGPN